MFVVDAQVHIWGPNRPERPWLAGRHPHRATPLGPDELLREMDAAGVTRAILVAPSWDDDRNDFVLDAARAHPDRFAVMGRFNPEASGAQDRIDRWLDAPGMLGMRCTFTLQQKAALCEGRVNWLWERAARAGIPVMALVTHAMAPLVDRIAAHHPALKLSLCHLALDTGVKDEAAFRDFGQLLALAARPNITVMASALPAYTSQPYPYPEVQAYIRRVYDAFGPRRMFWGTDLARQPCTYRQAVTLFSEELRWLTPDDKALIMGRALCEWLNWPMP